MNLEYISEDIEGLLADIDSISGYEEFVDEDYVIDFVKEVNQLRDTLLELINELDSTIDDIKRLIGD